MDRKTPKRYFNSYAQLYGDEKAPEAIPNKPQKKKASPKTSNLLTEREEQIRCVVWMAKNNIPHHHSPNGGSRNAIEAMNFKRMGTSPGFPDVFIPLARKGHHGLFVELKRVTGGKLSDAQQWWADILKVQGYAWFEAKGHEDFKRIVMDYLGMVESTFNHKECEG